MRTRKIGCTSKVLRARPRNLSRPEWIGVEVWLQSVKKNEVCVGETLFSINITEDLHLLNFVLFNGVLSVFLLTFFKQQKFEISLVETIQIYPSGHAT